MLLVGLWVFGCFMGYVGSHMVVMWVLGFWKVCITGFVLVLCQWVFMGLLVVYGFCG